jgi:hypothetical protein
MASAWRRAPVEVGSLAGDETHLIVLSTADRTLLRLLVAPPGLTREQADEALLASASGGSAHSATEDPDYRLDSRAGGDWRWAAWRPEGVRVAVSGLRFPSEQAARSAGRRVRNQAGTAIGP